MDKTITPMEARERIDYSKEICSLSLHEKAVIPREFFPFAIFITSEINEHYYGRVFVWNSEKDRISSLYFKFEQVDPENITIQKIAEREYLEELSNSMLRR